MSKRGAEEYITKENGSIPNDTDSGEKVKMATAAQLAKRKMAVPRSRRTGNTPTPGAPPSNPFAGTTAFGAPQSTSIFTNPGAVTFGTSQSFPPSESVNGGFSFAAPGQSSSFTFGQPTPNNPFANLNGNSGDPQPSSQDSNDITMESPQKKPAFGSNLFGANNAGSNTVSTGFSFGQSTSQPPSQPNFAFGQSQGFGGASGTSLFGQSTSKPPDASSTTSLFGQPLHAQSDRSSASPAFGQSSNTPPEQNSAPEINFGQTSTSASSSTPAFSFGQPSTKPTSSTPAFSFGQAATQSATNGPLFGAPSPSPSPAFGSSTANQQPAPSTSLFGTTSSGTSTNNVFAGFGSPKPVERSPSVEAQPVSEQPKISLFGQPTTTSQSNAVANTTVESEQPKTNPFAGLFSQQATKQSDQVTTAINEPPKPTFSFGTPAAAGGFAATKSASNDSAKSPDDTPKKPLFSFGTPSNTSSSGLFSPSKPSAEPPKPANPFAGLSAKKPESAAEKPQQSLFHTSEETPKKDQNAPTGVVQSFGSSHTPQPDPSSSKPFSGFGSPYATTTKPSTNQPTEQLSAPAKSTTAPSFGGFTPSTPLESTKSSTESPSSAKSSFSVPNTSSSVDLQPPPASNSMRSVNTHPPTRIPPYLNGDDYKAYDSNYRLHSLNREFQKRIASLDPSRDDFENIVRNYVAARESIGESIGLYTRNIAGMKRKADEGDDRNGSDSDSVKRNKQGDATPAKASFGKGQDSNSVFQPVPSSMSKTNTPSTNQILNKSAPSTASNASAIFSSMIPDNKSTSSTSNPFASLPKTNNSPSKGVNSTPSFSFGNSTGTTTTTATFGSTTPTKSPPKKPAFEMPKFAAPVGGTNFMDAFKKQSETSVAKLAKEAKEKRKAEEFDSDEDDEEEWNKKYEEEERAKKAKLGAVAQKGFTPVFGNGTSVENKPMFATGNSVTSTSSTVKPASASTFGNQGSGKSSATPIDISDNDASGEGDDDYEEGSEGSGSGSGSGTGNGSNDEEEDAEEDDLPEDEVNAEDEESTDDNIETALAKSRGKGKSLFERVTPNPSLQKNAGSASAPTPSIEENPSKKANLFSNVFNKGTPEAPSFSPLTPTGSKDPYVPSKTFNFNPTPHVASPSPVPGASIFAGGMMKDGPITGEGLFGSRPSTPSNADKPKTNVFGGLGTPFASFGGDQTWKKGTEIKFGSSTTEAPSVSITAPTPRKDESKPFANLFGADSSAATNALTSNNLGFSFGQSTAPGFLAAASHLAGGSGTNSGFSSRATSPGTTDNESVATNEEDFANDAQVSLMETRPGEENEDILFENRARAMRYYTEAQIAGTKFTKGWNAVGLGIARLLKHRETKKTRLVMRTEPGANVILNTNLQPEVKYDYNPAGSAGTVKFNVFTKEGVQGWTLKVKTQQLGQELAKLMEENKKAST